MSEPRVFDVSKNSWGHTINVISDNLPTDGTMQVLGCLTPLPNVGDIILGKPGWKFQVAQVKYLWNPRDAFEATLGCLASPEDAT